MKKIKQIIKHLEIDLYDKLFFSLYFVVASIMLYSNISILTIGGLLLILAAWFVYKGEIFLSVFVYLVADVMWVINAFSIGDKIGASFIIAGMFFGILATFKMQLGKMSKSLKIKIPEV